MDIKEIQDYFKNYKDLNIEQQKKLQGLFSNPILLNKFSGFLEELLWIKKPPTPEEFLNPNSGYLPVELIDSIYPFAKDNFIHAMNSKDPYKYIVNYGSTGCEKKDTEILMWDMSIKKIQDVKVGDLLMGDDSQPREVLRTVSGRSVMYEIIQNIGHNYTVNNEHFLVLWNTLLNKIEEILILDFIRLDNKIKKLYYGIQIDLNTKKFILNKIKVKRKSVDNFYGFELDGNHHYLHSDFTIVRNTAKSFLNQLYMVYSIIYVNLMRYPQIYYNLSPQSNICIYLVSFKRDKTRELLLSPILNILYASKVFKNVKYEDAVRKKGVTEDGLIYFSEACNIASMGGITTPKLLIVCGSNISAFLGGNVISGVVSEINHFKEMAHISDEQVMRIFSKLDGRITRTIVRDKFPCFLSLDSSANNADSPIESLVQKDLKKRKQCFYREYKRWEVLPQKFPNWAEANKIEGELIDVQKSYTWKKLWTTKLRNKETFPVCIGNGSHPAFIVGDAKQIEDIPRELIKYFPNDCHGDLEVDLIGSINDIGGFPSSSEAKLIQDIRLVDNIFKSELLNVEGEIIAGASSIPDRLIWNQIYKKFFLEIGHDRYQIKRALREPRFIGVDSAFAAKGCLMSVVVGHFESYKGIKKYIVDFSLAIAPDNTGINLQALEQFLIDLWKLGGLSIKEISMDTFQSKQTWQNLERLNLNISRLSVDDNIFPYQFLVTQLYINNIYAGKNIYLKNNLNSLYRQKNKKGNEVIDKNDGTPVHKYIGNWDTSSAGKYEKDVSDGLCRSVYIAFNNYQGLPVTDYEQENNRLGLTSLINTNLTNQMLVKRLLGVKDIKS